jgi:transposase-like protein
MHIKMHGKTYYLWRAVDADGHLKRQAQISVLAVKSIRCGYSNT